MLLAKTLRSTTFKLALVCIAIFGALVFALLGYVYWSTTSFVRSRSDHAITAELAILRKAYARAGRSGLTTTIAQRLVDQRFAGSVYLLADPSFAPLAGNLVDWPLAIKGSGGWGNFSARENQLLLRATFETLPDGSHLLVGKDVDDLDEFTHKIKAGLALCILLIFALAGLASVLITRRTVGASKPSTRPAVPSCEAASASGYPCAGHLTNGTNSPRTSIRCSTASKP